MVIDCSLSETMSYTFMLALIGRLSRQLDPAAAAATPTADVTPSSKLRLITGPLLAWSVPLLLVLVALASCAQPLRTPPFRAKLELVLV